MTTPLIVSVIVIAAIAIALFNVLKYRTHPELKTVISLRGRANSNMTEKEIEFLTRDVMDAMRNCRSSFAKVELSNILLFLEELKELTESEHITHQNIVNLAEYCYDKVYFGCDKEDKSSVASHIKFWRMMNKKIKHRTFTIEDIQRAYRAGKNGWYRQKGNERQGFVVGKFKGTEEEYLNDIKSKR